MKRHPDAKALLTDLWLTAASAPQADLCGYNSLIVRFKN